MARKGDIVALQTKKTHFYCNPYRHEDYEEWTLVRVASAKRDGTVTAIRMIDAGGDRSYASKLQHMAYNTNIHCLPNHQDQARRLMATRTSGDWFGSCDLLKAAILAA